MNKLVIVGNGFDLAHGLPTSYKHFIDDFWKNLKHNYKKEAFKEIVFINETYSNFLTTTSVESFNDLIVSLKGYAEEYKYRYEDNNYECYTNYSNFHPIFKFENTFFKEINSKNSIENWVDIENEYYQKLKLIAKKTISSYSGSRQKAEKEQSNKNKKEVEKLNTEFEQIKNLFINYLTENTQGSFDFLAKPKNPFPLLQYFKLEYMRLKDGNNILQEFPVEDRNDLIDADEYLNRTLRDGKLDRYLYTVCFLNFNYSNSLMPYRHHYFNNYDHGKAQEIQIHGHLDNENNEVNFGFGDEMDEDYKLIENLNDNEYLKNFKSFKYSQNSNYSKLLGFIDSEKFQVYIMGHSCGLSDRTMLNTIFEHNNCRSIKVFYYEWLNEDGEKQDNFTEIVQNISRHFNDKKSMREKIVNKSLCKPLPQDIRFQEKQKPS